MRGALILSGSAAAVAALVVVALFAALTEGPRANVAHASGIDEAARELDLIRPARPKQASDFSVSLLGGQTLELKGQRGKPMLINFWATWCAPCREEMPAMERLYVKHRERGFVLLAVSVDTDAALVKPPLCHLNRGPGCIYHGLLCHDLTLTPKRSTLLRQRCLQRLYFCCGRAEIGSHLIEALLSRGARWRKLFGSPQVELDAIASRLGVGKVGFRLGNLGLLGPRL